MSILIGLVGDLLIDRPNPPEVFADVAGLLRAPDLLFGNLEAAFTDDPHPAPSLGVALFPGAATLDAFAPAGFSVLNMANNHIVDAGHAAMLDNRDRLRRQGVRTCGAGATLKEAREPAIIDTNGVRVAFLGYASMFPMGYEARSNVPGLAPLRAYDLWRPALDNYHAPGTPPRAQTVVDETDLAHLAEDIEAARARADLVVASFHWSDFLRPHHLTDHETRTARWCIDQGVDMVVGHHHHALRGIEWYRGKPIFYGLGHFVFDLRVSISEEARRLLAGEAYGIFPRPGWPLLPLHEDTRMTLLAWARADAGGVSDIGVIPCMLRPDGRVSPVDPDGEEGRQVIAYLERCNETQNLNGRVVPAHELALAGHRGVRIVPVSPERTAA